MKKGICILLCCLLLCTGCNSNSLKTTIAYGSKFELKDYFKLEKNESIHTDLQVDTKISAKYKVKAIIENAQKKSREESKELKVKDKDKPEITFVQSEKEVYEIPFKSAFNMVGNIDKIADKVDGEYKKIRIVNKNIYDEEILALKKAKEDLSKKVFTTNEEIENYKNNRYQHSYTLIQSDLKLDKEGVYEIHVMSVDASYNMVEKMFKVKVLKENEKVNEDKKAVGLEGTKLGAATAYEVINERTALEEQPKEEAKKEEAQLPASDEESQKKFQSNIAASGTVSAKGNPVLQAALNYVGAHMMCDDLATMALVDSGYLTGTPEKIFKNGAYYNIGVYQMSALGSYISEASAQPGDLILYDNGGYGSMHVAVYAGNGQAVHGGYMGANVVVSTVYIGSGPKYFRVPKMTWKDVSKKIFGHDIDDNGNIIYPDWNPPTDTPSTPDDNNGSQNPSTPPEEDPWGDIEWGEGNTTYTSTITHNAITISLSSSTPIDTDYVFAQLKQVESGQISMDQMYANLSAKGYNVTG